MTDGPVAGAGEGPGSARPGREASQPGSGRRGRHAAAADLAETLILPAQRAPEDAPAGQGQPAPGTSAASNEGMPGSRPAGRHSSGTAASGSAPIGSAPIGSAVSESAPSGTASNGSGARTPGTSAAAVNGSAADAAAAGRPSVSSAGHRPARAPVPASPAPAARRDDRLRLVWVYPDLLSTYGDRGNLLVLSRRARLRGIDVEPVEVNSDQSVPADGDIYLLGGGEDLPQILAATRLRADGGLRAAIDRGAAVFAVCAGYQLLGHEFGGVEGEPVEGLGLLDISSGRGERRGVGELVADADPALGVPRLTGFENHQGVTRLGPGAWPLASVSLGVGNGDGTEGAYAGKILGTYMHGPALARNPGLADLLLSWAAGRLAPIPVQEEEWASQLRAERLAAVAQ